MAATSLFLPLNFRRSGKMGVAGKHVNHRLCTTPGYRLREAPNLSLARTGNVSTSGAAGASANATLTASRARSRCARTNLRLVLCRRARRVTGSALGRAARPSRLRSGGAQSTGARWGHGEIAESEQVARPARFANRSRCAAPLFTFAPHLPVPRRRSKKVEPLI